MRDDKAVSHGIKGGFSEKILTKHIHFKLSVEIPLSPNTLDIIYSEIKIIGSSENHKLELLEPN